MSNNQMFYASIKLDEWISKILLRKTSGATHQGNSCNNNDQNAILLYFRAPDESPWDSF